MKNKVIFLLLALSLICIPVFAEDNQKTDVVFFYGTGCPHCAALEKFLDEIKDSYNLNVVGYEVYFNNTNRELGQKMAEEYGDSFRGVPMTFIGDNVFVGFSDKIGEEIEAKIQSCQKECCDSPLDKVKLCEAGKATIQKLTLPAVIGAAAVDAINPCAFAVLIILLTTILAAKKRSKVIAAGLAFSLSVFLSYYLMGIGLYSAVRAAGFTRIFYIIVAILAILVGLFNLKDYLWYGKWFVMEVPMRWRPTMKLLIKSVTSIPGAFFIGFIVSLFLLPCTSGPYIVILGLLAKSATRNSALLYLLLYNFIFVLPMLIITALIGFGFATTEEAEEWRQKKLKVLHLIAGIIILLLGIGMLISLALGMV